MYNGKGKNKNKKSPEAETIRRADGSPNTINPIQWFPGHMAKTRRLIKESLPLVDIVAELLDARIPVSSRNPEIAGILANKPSLIILNKSDLADANVNNRWISYFKERGQPAVLADCTSSKGLSRVTDAINEVMHEKLERYKEKGMEGRKIRAMIVGIPNVGKSSLINRLCGNYKAKVENRPGVTMREQWVPTLSGIDLLDMPGVLWHKFDDKQVGENLGMTGAIKDNIMDLESLAAKFCDKIKVLYPQLLCERYKIEAAELERTENGFEILEMIARKRGFIVSGGEADYERCAITVLGEFRNGKTGRISLETPDR